MVLKSRDYVFKMSIFKKLGYLLYCTLYSVHWYISVHIKKLSLRAAVVSITAYNVRGVSLSDWWICNIIRHKTLKAFLLH